MAKKKPQPKRPAVLPKAPPAKPEPSKPAVTDAEIRDALDEILTMTRTVRDAARVNAGQKYTGPPSGASKLASCQCAGCRMMRGEPTPGIPSPDAPPQEKFFVDGVPTDPAEFFRKRRDEAPIKIAPSADVLPSIPVSVWRGVIERPRYAGNCVPSARELAVASLNERPAEPCERRAVEVSNGARLNRAQRGQKLVAGPIGELDIAVVSGFLIACAELADAAPSEAMRARLRKVLQEFAVAFYTPACDAVDADRRGAL